MAHDVFVCHSGEDREAVDAVCDALASRQIRYWIARGDISPGDGWAESIVDAIEGSQVLVVVLSSNSIKSSHVERELHIAVDKGIPVIPFQIDDAALSRTMAYLLYPYQHLDAQKPPLKRHIPRLVNAVQQFLSQESMFHKEEVVPAEKQKPVVDRATVSSGVLSLTERLLYRHAFVGRKDETGQLQSAFEAAASKNGALVMIEGQPGVGKTAICEELSKYVKLRGGKTLTGQCYREGQQSLPYLAFVEILRSYALTRSIKELKKDLGSGVTDLARIVPELRERLKTEPIPAQSPEEERYRLMQAMTNFLGRISVEQPLLVIFEDLNDADSGTLEMLSHVCRNLAGNRILVVVTYRGAELDRTPQLSTTLADLYRLSGCIRIRVGGLSVSDVRDMLNTVSGQEVSRRLVEFVHHRSEGNPFFALEVLRYLADRGLVTSEEGRLQPTGSMPLEMSVPEGLREVIYERFSFLSPECNRLLRVASVIGREFQLKVLQQVTDISEDELFNALDEAKRAAVVEEHSSVGATVDYRFVHAFFRQTLYEDIIAPRRGRLHQQVARILEEMHDKQLEEHAAELAEHFSYSPDSADLVKAVTYGEMAAKQARAVYAYGEAVRILEMVLKVQEQLGPGDKVKRCDLLLTLGDALIDAGEPQRFLGTEGPAAWSLAEAMADNIRASRVCQLAMWALFYYGVGRAWASPEAAQWAELADHYAQPNTVARARADTAMGSVKCAKGYLEEGIAFLDRALNLARDLGDPDTFWWAAAMWMTYASGLQHAEEHLNLAEELKAGSRVGVSLGALIFTLIMVADTFLDWGQRSRLEEVWRETEDLIERSGQARYLVFSMTGDALFAALDGHLEEATQITEHIRTHGEELGLTELTGVPVFLSGLRPMLHIGKVDEALELYEALYGHPADAITAESAAGALCLAHLDRSVEAKDILERLIQERPSGGSVEDETPASQDTLLLEVAVLVKHHQAADLLLRRLSGTRLRTTGIFYTTCIARHLGAAAVLLGRLDEARAYYQSALEVANEMRFRPEVALTRFQLAELILEHYPQERAEALEHLDFAIAEFRDMKMQPSLKCALRSKDILTA